MVSCSSCGCSLTAKNKEAGVTFHSFPKNEKQKAKWIAFLRKPEFIPKKSSVLCSHHFTENCFDRTSSLVVRLFPGAIPTIEVDRLKYVRTFNPLFTSSIIDVHNESTNILPTISARQESFSSLQETALEELEEKPRELNLKRKIHDLHDESTNILPSISAGQESFSSLQETALEESEETPRELILKRKIHDLERTNSLKNVKIRKLQKIICRQKKRISSLKAMTKDLKKKFIV